MNRTEILKLVLTTIETFLELSGCSTTVSLKTRVFLDIPDFDSMRATEVAVSIGAELDCDPYKVLEIIVSRKIKAITVKRIAEDLYQLIALQETA